MLNRKLSALGHPSPDKVNINDAQEFRNLILWLEDQKIRNYKIEDREGLRQTTSNDWQKAFDKYLKDLACPLTKHNPAEQLEWLLSFAVRLEFADNIDKYGSTGNVKKIANAPKIISSNPLDNLDFQSADFKKGVNTIASLLNITSHPDHLVTLKAISKVVTTRLSSQAQQNPNSVIVKGIPIPLKEANLGFNSGDYVFNEAAKLLRLLYIQDLRKLQTTINETIVGVQTITANPKTDTKLGKVGK